MMPKPYRHSRTSRAVLSSLIPVICPPEAHELREAIVEHVGLTLAAAPPALTRGFVAGLLTYDLGALPIYGRRAHKLTIGQAERYFENWERGATPLHSQFARLVNQLISLACYEQPAMTERLGYRPGPWIEEVRRKRLSVFADSVQRQATQLLAPDPLRPGVWFGRQRGRA